MFGGHTASLDAVNQQRAQTLVVRRTAGIKLQYSMKTEAQALAQSFLGSGENSENFTFPIKGSNDCVIVYVVRSPSQRAKLVTETIEKTADRINHQSISFLPAGRCECCGK